MYISSSARHGVAVMVYLFAIQKVHLTSDAADLVVLQVAGPKGVAIGAAVGGGPGAAIGSLADKGSANKDAEKISKQVEESGNHPKHGSATKGMTDPTAQ